MDESTHISRVQTLDGRTWELLVVEHQEAVFRLAYLLLGDAHEAEDVAQETFLRAFNARERFDSTRPARPWLLRITADLASNRRRSLGRYLATLRRFGQAVPHITPDVSQSSQEQANARELWQAVRTLKQADQEVIYLRYFLELSEAELAQALGVAQGTVKSRLHRALSRLRAIIERDYLDDR